MNSRRPVNSDVGSLTVVQGNCGVLMLPTPEDDLAHLLASPQYWTNKAIALRASAAAVWYCINSTPRVDLTSALGSANPIDITGDAWQVYRMLCGMSLELAYKASLIAMGQKIKTTHDLVWLAEQVCSNLSRTERGLLELLTQCVVWDGRYPAPKDALSLEYFVYLSFENLYRKERTENTTILKPIEPNPLDWENYDTLWKTAVDAYDWHSF